MQCWRIPSVTHITAVRAGIIQERAVHQSCLICRGDLTAGHVVLLPLAVETWTWVLPWTPPAEFALILKDGCITVIITTSKRKMTCHIMKFSACVFCNCLSYSEWCLDYEESTMLRHGAMPETKGTVLTTALPCLPHKWTVSYIFKWSFNISSIIVPLDDTSVLINRAYALFWLYLNFFWGL